jgi:hypothetical protein
MENMPQTPHVKKYIDLNHLLLTCYDGEFCRAVWSEKYRPNRLTIAIDKGMVVGGLGMKDDRPNYQMKVTLPSLCRSRSHTLLAAESAVPLPVVESGILLRFELLRSEPFRRVFGAGQPPHRHRVRTKESHSSAPILLPFLHRPA